MGLYFNFQYAHTFGVDTIPFIFALAFNGIGNGGLGLLIERPHDLRTRIDRIRLIDKVLVVRHYPRSLPSRDHTAR